MSEITIEFSHSMQLGIGGYNSVPAFKHELAFQNTIIQNNPTLIIANSISFNSKMGNNIHVVNPKHFMFVIQAWQPDYDTQVSSVGQDGIEIISIITVSLNLTRDIYNLVIMNIDLEAYKQVPAQNFGE